MTRYRIVPERSRVWIAARSNVHPIHSTTDGLEGFVDLDDHDSQPVTVGERPVGTLSLRVARLTSGNRFEDRELHKRIDARRYPTIDGVLTGMTAGAMPGTCAVSGDVTFRGVTRSYAEVMAVSRVDATTINLSGEASFDIRDFGMQPPRILMLRVEPVVTVRVEIVATAER
jgi:polyisoprenoid-binding protein YceI